eukprot:TRINITY_DN39486_c0_g1_i1.p1 TRINITY_DN39486_c0_g1~~TRINITY_DN39486_c0_g1_i1.p1  ORF type:complete len:298 (-),score=30.32 TRINITY_DN39486_c0_g1_i1:48-941(-)
MPQTAFLALQLAAPQSPADVYSPSIELCGRGRCPTMQHSLARRPIPRRRPLLVGRRSYEPFGGIYARDWAMNKRPARPLRGAAYWLWIPAGVAVLSVAWATARSWTRALICLCVVSYVVQCYWPRWEEESVLMPYTLAAREEIHRLFLSAFCHASWWHLALNMYSLWYLGLQLESLYGAGRFIYLYLASAAGAAISSLLLVRQGQASASAGASGAIYGMVGALLVFRFRHGLPIRQLLYILAISAAIGAAAPDTDNAGHAGGLATGALVGYLWGPRFVYTMGNLLVKDSPLICWPFV